VRVALGRAEAPAHFGDGASAFPVATEGALKLKELAYIHALALASAKGYDVDQPRNLAKSVTGEYPVGKVDSANVFA
jgi:glucosamine 6-phosphate synthetase-like amidotransferase/phosphosugar isomerase protein